MSNLDTGFPVITICGSTRFADIMMQAAQALTAHGYIVLMPFVADYANGREPDDTKRMLDELHRAKISLSDRIMVVTDDSKYVGDSTRGEIKYARMTGKPVDWWQTNRVVLTEMDIKSAYPAILTGDTDDA